MGLAIGEARGSQRLCVRGAPSPLIAGEVRGHEGQDERRHHQARWVAHVLASRESPTKPPGRRIRGGEPSRHDGRRSHRVLGDRDGQVHSSTAQPTAGPYLERQVPSLEVEQAKRQHWLGDRKQGDAVGFMDDLHSDRRERGLGRGDSVPAEVGRVNGRHGRDRSVVGRENLWTGDLSSRVQSWGLRGCAWGRRRCCSRGGQSSGFTAECEREHDRHENEQPAPTGQLGPRHFTLPTITAAVPVAGALAATAGHPR